mgnify:CR=1 FL=1
MKVSLVIPALNEEKTVGDVVSKALRYVDEVIVVDDGSSDRTSEVALAAGARVIRHARRMGYYQALKTGFKAASGDVILTMGADGQHDPADIPRVLRPIVDGRADLVLGVRRELPHFSERFIRALVNLYLRCSDASTGLIAIRREILMKMKMRGDCPCGTFILEAHTLGARITEVPIKVRPRLVGPRRMKTRHLLQSVYVLLELLRTLIKRLTRSWPPA